MQDAEFRITLRGDEELRIVVHMREGKLREQRVETKDFCLLGPEEMVIVACDRILELSIARKLLRLGNRRSFSLVVALWEGGLPVDLLPAEGWFEVRARRRPLRLGVRTRPDSPPSPNHGERSYAAVST